MQNADWIILIGYLAGTVFIGVFLGRIVKNASDMFSAGGRSPWWLSGLSAFMTMFSANTFVVWGGIAYQHGLVAVTINICYGVAALLAGYTVAGKWKKLGIETPAEYIEKRFGRGAVHFYTWFMMTFRLVGTGGALYAIARLTLAIIAGDTGPEDGALASSQLNIAIVIFAAIVVGYTMIGGLWAVLMTDTLQFIVLNLAVIFVIPLSLVQVGGFEGFLQQAPEGFLALTQPMSDSEAKYTWLFLIGWVAIHYFMIGAEWAFVQRYLCVPSESDARKSSYLFGALYLFSPFLWLLPPLLWRIRQPIPEGADAAAVTKMAETAYILSCKAVLPNGMLGLMLAALFSATASMISSQLNVFSGVLTRNIYQPLVGQVSDRQLIFMGRVFTCVLGVFIAGVAMATPHLGGAAKVIITVTEIMVTPLLAPTLFALFFRNLGLRAIWATVGICFPLGLLAKFTGALSGLWIADTTFIGVILPMLIVGFMILVFRGEDPGWARIEKSRALAREAPQVESSALPALIVSISLAICALTLFALILVNTRERVMLAAFGSALLLLSGGTYALARKLRARQAA
jgi:solute:Na+ symporter, SSS family